MQLYKAVVKSVESGTRNITVSTPHLQQCTYLVKPFFDGVIKTSVPEVDEFVWVLDLTGTATTRKYIPVELEFETLTTTPDNVQIESKADLEIEAGTIYLGANAENWIALANLVNDAFSAVSSDIDSIVDSFNLHTHAETGTTTDVPTTTISGVPQTYDDVSSSKTKSE